MRSWLWPTLELKSGLQIIVFSDAGHKLFMLNVLLEYVFVHCLLEFELWRWLFCQISINLVIRRGNVWVSLNGFETRPTSFELRPRVVHLCRFFWFCSLLRYRREDSYRNFSNTLQSNLHSQACNSDLVSICRTKHSLHSRASAVTSNWLDHGFDFVSSVCKQLGRGIRTSCTFSYAR